MWGPPLPHERNGQIIGYAINISKSGDSDNRIVYNASGTDYSFYLDGTHFHF